MAYFGLGAIFTLVLVVFCWKFRRYPAKLFTRGPESVEDRTLRHRTIADLNCPPIPLPDRLRLRAGPNQRLVRAFGIDNSFTTTDKTLHKKFAKSATDAIDLVKDKGWSQLGFGAEKILNSCIFYLEQKSPSQAGLPLATLMRITCFGVMIHLFFGVEASKMDQALVEIATEAIHKLWISSKDEDATPSADDKKRLEAALAKLIDADVTDLGDGGALNLIIPAYETLWRVVMLTFVAASHCNKNNNVTTKRLLTATRTVPRCFGNNAGEEDEARTIAKVSAARRDRENAQCRGS